jgi:NAD(P)-dependent dehydrogenase (short-subunit alcohol dehydrogenase family)
MHFAKNGYHVFAGVRKASDVEALKTDDHSGNLEPVMLDVTNELQLNELKSDLSMKTGDAGLAGLVNNAGIARGSPLEFVATQDVRDMFNVNVMGPLLLTQAFLPLLRVAKGRIVTVGSIGGKVANPMMGAYCISKFGLEAFNDALRQEVAPHGIHVSLIEPGPIQTPLLQSSDRQIQETIDSLSMEGKELYGEFIEQMRNYLRGVQGNALQPQAVVDAVEHALESGKPKTRYLVTTEAKVVNFLRWAVPDRVLDLVLAKTFAS